MGTPTSKSIWETFDELANFQKYVKYQRHVLETAPQVWTEAQRAQINNLTEATIALHNAVAKLAMFVKFKTDEPGHWPTVPGSNQRPGA